MWLPLLFPVLVVCAAAIASLPVIMHAVPVLRFESSELADRVRSPPQPSMQCVGGNACHETNELPRRALCENKGVDDGKKVIWRCAPCLASDS